MTLLGETIAQLFDPAPEVDPENAFDDDTLARNENVDTGVDVELNPSRMRGIDLGDSYQGKVVSRTKLNEWDNDDAMNLEFDDDMNDDESDDQDDEPLRVIPVIESDAEDDDMYKEEFDTLFEDQDEQSAGLKLDSLNKPQKHSLDRFNTADEENATNQLNEFASMMNKQMDKAEEIQKQEQQMKVISDKKELKPQSFQLRKAKAVAAQTKLYDKVATLRIHLQKPFQLAQKLPRPSVHCELMNEMEKDGEKTAQVGQKRKLKQLLNEVSDKALSLTDNIMNLQSKLLCSNDEYPDELRYRKRRRLNNENDSSSNVVRFEGLWDEMNSDWSDFLPFCNKTMDLWDKKMRLVDNYSSKKDKKTQSLLERIALIIENPQRILHKMQSVDKLFRMYGDDAVKVKDGEGDAGEDDIHKKDERIRNGMENVSRLKFEKYRMECEVFNDSQFYRRMLKEIIDIGHAATFKADAIHRKMDQIQYEKTQQKLAFHKAKLRMKYTIRPDMENFMAPIYDHDADFPVEQLYNSLFQ
eukprot:240527_1